MRRNRLAMAAFGLVLLPSLRLLAQQTEERIGGRVVSARDGHPLAHATVNLWSRQSQRNVGTVITDGEGHFRFDPLPAGKYRLTGTAPGYLTAAYMQHEQYATAIVTGAGLATDSLELRLMPVASLSGRVSDGPEPVQRATVSLYRETPGAKGGVTRDRSTQTDDEGVFEFDRLGEGKYFLSASGAPWYAVHPPVEPDNARVQYREAVDPSLDAVYPTVFYPDALDSSSASPIEIHGGEQITANLLMHPVHAVTLTMRLAPGEGPNQPFAQLTLTTKVFGLEDPVFPQMSQMNGVRQISGLAPAEYSVQPMAANGMPEHSRTVDLRGGSMAIDDEGAVETASVSVTVHRADGLGLPDHLAVTLRGSASSRTGPSTRLDDKGVAEISGAPAGEYRLSFSGVLQAVHLVALSVDGKPVADGGISVVGNAHVAVDATISSAAVEVDGFVHREGKAVAGMFVVLVPAGSGAGEELVQHDQSDLDGSFTFNNVAQGSYIVFATDDVAALQWTDTATLLPYLPHGIAVSVPASGATVVHLSAPVDEQGAGSRE